MKVQSSKSVRSAIINGMENLADDVHAPATETGTDFRFSKILRAMAVERRIGLMAACEALLQEHPEYRGPDALVCRATARAMVRKDGLQP